MAQAPVFLVVFATLGLAVQREWIAFAIFVTCLWVYARILGHDYVVSQVEGFCSRAVLAVAARLPERPIVVTQPAPDVEEDPLSPIGEAPQASPAPPRRAPRRVRPVEVSPTKRLLQLEELRENGLVTAAEYQDKRQEILRAI